MTSTASIAPDKGEAADQADAAFDQLCALLRDAPDLTPMAIGHWAARDVAAHLAGGLPIYTGLVRDEASPADTIEAIEAVNESVVAGVPEQDGPTWPPGSRPARRSSPPRCAAWPATRS